MPEVEGAAAPTRPAAEPDYKDLMSQLDRNKRKASCRVCGELSKKGMAFVREAIRKGFTYREIAQVLAPTYGDLLKDLQRHSQNGHPDPEG